MIRLTAPSASVTSPLAIVVARYEGVSSRVATVRVGNVIHYVELRGETGELRENITLLEGENRIEVEIDGERDTLTVTLPPSSGVTLVGSPGGDTPRALELTGSYEGVSCPAGVISCNGFLQQFATPAENGSYSEKVVLRPGDNHLAVQIGEKYATRLVQGSFAPAKLVTTLLWDTNGTDVDLYVSEPGGGTVYYSRKQGIGVLDVDRRNGWGPENYSIGTAERPIPPGRYGLRVHFYSGGGGFRAGGVGRTEWTARVVIDEATPRQQKRNFWGVLEVSNSGNHNPGSTGPDWQEICEVQVDANGVARIV